MENVEAMRKWYQAWSKKPETITALKSLKAIKPDDARSIAITQERVAIACFNAAHYRPERDPGEIYRAKIAKQRKQMAKLQKAAKVLAEAALENHRGLDYAETMATYASGLGLGRADPSEVDLIDPMRVRIRINREPRSGHLGTYDYYSALEKALKGRLPEIHGGPYKYRTSKGNLSFDRHISRGRKITTETMLAFELAFYLRMHTAGRADDGWGNGQGMPDDGDPCFHIVGLFCDAVFDLNGNYEPSLIADNVRNLKNAGLIGWIGVNSA